MQNVFAYGSLMFPEVMFKVTKGQYQSAKAVLRNYTRKQVKNQVYPGLTK